MADSYFPGYALQWLSTSTATLFNQIIGNTVVDGIAASAGSGLTLNIASGDARINGYWVAVGTGHTETMTASATNYVWLQLTLNGSSQLTGWTFIVNTTGTNPGNAIPIATVVTGASSITTVTDTRGILGIGYNAGFLEGSLNLNGQTLPGNATFSGNLTLSGGLTLNGAISGSGGPLVSSLSATNGLSVSNPTGIGAASYSIVLNGPTLSNGSSGLSLNLANANTWTALQTFGTDISFMGEQVSGATITSGTFLYDNGTNWVRQALVAGTNISVSNATINVINNPTFSGLVTANAGLSSTTGTFSGLLTANGAINVPTGSYYQANGSDVLGWDGSNVILNLASVGAVVVKSGFRAYSD
ncbi:MAG: hypothetical protein ACYCQJ_15325, partial [Nitrososphaerales archaeon]